MNDVKWIKLTTSMFDNEKIKLIESLPAGDSILIVWIKLLTLAGKTNEGGFIYLNKDIAYTNDMLSSLFGRKLNIIILSLKTFREFGMIEVDENDRIYIPNWEKHQNVDGLKKIREQGKIRQQRHRKKQSNLLGITQSLCVYCGKKATGFDHVIPTVKGGVDKEFNKVFCCSSCNRIKNDKDLLDFLNFNRELIIDESIENSVVLSKIVTLCNVTERYIVTENNATDIELEEERDIKDFPDSDESGENFYLTKKKKKLTGKRLETFNNFWEIFDYKKGKADAADSWLNIPQLTNSLVQTIFNSAKFEAENRETIISKGQTPKHAQGWLSSRRWEDEIQSSLKTTVTKCDLPTL